MKTYVILIVLAATLLTPIMARSSQEAQRLGICLTDSLNGKERKNLAKWIYFGMSAHSIMRPYSNITRKEKEKLDKYVADLITRLLTKDCPKQTASAFKENGSEGLKYAFGVVGKVAMQELMNEPKVSRSLGAFEKYINKDKFKNVFK